MKQTIEQPTVSEEQEEKIEEQPIEEGLDEGLEAQEEESPDQMLLKAAFDKVYDFEPTTEEEKWSKAGIQESLEDISLLFEDDEEVKSEDQTPSSTLIALRGLEEIQNNYPLSTDVGLEDLKKHCAEKIQKSEGFGIDEIEDLDAMLEQNEGVDKMTSGEELTSEQLSGQDEKMRKYAEIKKDVEAKQKALMKNSNGFYGGFAEKIKKSFEKTGGKLDTKMMNSKLLKMIGEKKLTTRFSKVAAGGVIVMVGGMMMFNVAESEGAEIDSDKMTEKPDLGKDSFENESETEETNEEILAKLDASQEKVIEFISDLGIFSQIKLISEIKEHSEEIKELLSGSGANIITSSNKNLNKVVDMYTGPLNEVRESNPEIFEQEAQKICKLIDTIKTSSLMELKEKFA